MSRKTISSRLVVADSPLVIEGNREFRGYRIIIGSGNAYIKVYDGVATGGTEIWEDVLLSTTLAGGVIFLHPYLCGTELRIVLVGATAVLYVLHD